MVNLPKLTDLDVSGKRVFIRADLDVPVVKEGDSFVPVENYRLEAIKETFEYCLENGASKIIIAGHMGRPGPEDHSDAQFSTKTLTPRLQAILGHELSYKTIEEAVNSSDRFILLENLRYHDGEEKDDPEFARELADLADVYINEAFAVSHREHASIVGIPKVLRDREKDIGNNQSAALGIWFEREIENLSKAIDNPARPLVVLISGIKEDKIAYAKEFEKFADRVLVGGRLPEIMDIDKSVREYSSSDKMIVGNLTMDKFDITLNTIAKFKSEIEKAKTIILAGVLGKYEEEGHDQGTKEIFNAVASSSAFKIVGGGDSLAAIEKYDIRDKFNWVSVGGGAMLEFLTKKTLPAIEALK